MKNKASALGRIFSALFLSSALLLLTPAAFAGLTEFFSATGTLSLSVDAGGSNSAQGHVIEVEKPNAAATVRKAFVLAASTGFSGRVLDHGDVAIDGTPIHWDAGVSGAILNSNHRADVTAIVKPVVDAAAPGRVPFTFTEVKPAGIDGEILVVVFDDPAQSAATTVSLLFGAQDIAGDNFSIALAQPIDPNAPGALADMGLGISFGCQPGGQLSTVDVNGLRLSSSAGGKKAPGVCKNGQLITVGGLDDSDANPNPNALPASSRADDGLYSLLPFITSSDTTIAVDTRNPSNDDNLFFAYLRLSVAVVRNGVALSPTSATSAVGTQHTVTAVVTDQNGAAAPGKLVTFNVISGPNVGDNGTGTTDANGATTFTYTGDGGVGTDRIQGSFVDSQNVTRLSDPVSKDWTPAPNTPPLADPQSVTTDEDTQIDIILTGSDAEDDPLTFPPIVTQPQHGTLDGPFSATNAQTSKAKRQVKARLLKERKIPGTRASTLTLKKLNAIAQAVPGNSVLYIYKPDPDYNGPDSFTFIVNDGTVDSAPAIVNITVTPTQDNPEIQNLTFARRDSSDPNYSTPGIAALVDFRDKDGDFDLLEITLLKAKNKPKGCAPGVIESDEASIFPISENRTGANNPFAFVSTEIKTVEIGPNAMAVAAANGCAITLEITAFSIRGLDAANPRNSSNVLSGTFSIDSDTGPTPEAVSQQVRASQLRSSKGTKKIAAPVVR